MSVAFGLLALVFSSIANTAVPLTKPDAIIHLSSPLPGTVYQAPAAVTLQADVLGTNFVPVRVEFFSGSTNLGAASLAPYTLTWSDVGMGTYWLTAIASDAQGNLAASAPVEIAVIGPDCGAASILTVTNAPASQTDTNSAQVYFGQDVSPYQPFFGPNQVARPADIPLSRRAAETFLARLPGVATETFESYQPGDVPTDLTFGTESVMVSGEQGIVEVTDPNGTNNGEFPVSGSKGLELVGNAGTGFFGLDFATPQAAFGFYATDIELNGLEVTLVSTNGTNRVFTVPVTIPQGTAGALFWGVIDRNNPFVHVDLTRTGSLEDGFLFDNLTLATPAQVWAEPTWPLLSVADAKPVTAPQSGTVQVIFPITLSQPLPVPTTVEYSTTNGTALSGTEYLATNGLLTLLPGQTNAAIGVSILKGQGNETSRSFSVQLRNPSHALLANCQAQALILQAAPSNPPPATLSITITSPPNEAVYCPGTDIPITAVVQSSRTVTNVEIFEGTTLLATMTAPPFTFVIDKSRVTPGDYVFIAKAADDQGNTALSQPVRVAVSDVCGDVAIIRPGPDPEIDQLVNDLFEIGLAGRVFDVAGLTYEMLQPYQTIIWDDLGRTNAGLSDAFVNTLLRTQTNGAGLYLIGEHLVGAAANLTGTNALAWTGLTHLGAANVPPCDGTIQVQSSISNDPLLHGRFGTVEDFMAPSAPEAAQLSGADAEVIGHCATRDVMVAYPGFEVPDVGQPRVFAQNVRVVTGTNAVSLAQRKNLFQNVICWLHHCQCTTFDVALQASGSQPQARAGDTLSYTLLISHSGECEATGAVLTDSLPPGLVFVGVESEQGSCRYDPVLHTMTCDLGHLAKSSTTPVIIDVQAALPGTWTNLAAVRINGEVQTNNNFASIVTSVTGTATALRMQKASAQLVQLQLQSDNAGPYRIQTSADLKSWNNWLTNVIGPSWSTNLAPVGSRMFYQIGR